MGLILVASIVLLAHASASSNRPEAESHMPAGLVAGDPLAWGADWWKECNSAVYRLSAETARAIEQHGVGAFDAMDRPADGSQWAYVPWLATPVDIESRESWSQNGYVWGGLACGLNADWASRSQALGTTPGGFYSFGDGVLLLVDPAQGIVIYTQRTSLH
jgi:hypothetical protein